MEFTEAEAKAKVGRWVRVRDDSLRGKRIAQGTSGEVVSAQLYHREEESRKERVWVVCLTFSLTPDGSTTVLLRDIDKKQYAGCFEEIPIEQESEGELSPLLASSAL